MSSETRFLNLDQAHGETGFLSFIDLYGNNENELISQSNNEGISSENLNIPLDAGTYYVRVYPKSDARTDYRLSFDVI